MTSIASCSEIPASALEDAGVTVNVIVVKVIVVVVTVVVVVVANVAVVVVVTVDDVVPVVVVVLETTVAIYTCIPSETRACSVDITRGL
jgi:hypothetical protein